eukprot:m.59743 g.59743  ORF g.59743 m.59743 type:complete len:87 (-) comp11779_c0_seq3:782-1042(-)
MKCLGACTCFHWGQASVQDQNTKNQLVNTTDSLLCGFVEHHAINGSLCIDINANSQTAPNLQLPTRQGKWNPTDLRSMRCRVDLGQ